MSAKQTIDTGEREGAKDPSASDAPLRLQPTSFAQVAAASPVNVGAATSAD